MTTQSTLIPALNRVIARVRRARAQARTEIALGSLPQYIQKDIGWPDGFAERHGRGDA